MRSPRRLSRPNNTPTEVSAPPFSACRGLLLQMDIVWRCMHICTEVRAGWHGKSHEWGRKEEEAWPPSEFELSDVASKNSYSGGHGQSSCRYPSGTPVSRCSGAGSDVHLVVGAVTNVTAIHLVSVQASSFQIDSAWHVKKHRVCAACR